jgi:hypothetical protein
LDATRRQRQRRLVRKEKKVGTMGGEVGRRHKQAQTRDKAKAETEAAATSMTFAAMSVGESKYRSNPSAY